MEEIILKRALLLLAVFGCMFIAQASSGQEREPWRSDWQKFGEAIAPYARDGILVRNGNFREFNRMFNKEVEWTGTLKAFHANGVAKFLTLEMKTILIPLSDGNAIEVKELAVSCANEKKGCEGWSAELIGSEVTFRTELINRTRGYLPVVRVEGVGESTQRIEIETYGAEFIRVVPK